MKPELHVRIDIRPDSILAATEHKLLSPAINGTYKKIRIFEIRLHSNFQTHHSDHLKPGDMHTIKSARFLNQPLTRIIADKYLKKTPFVTLA
jgi:hypothetical protein